MEFKKRKLIVLLFLIVISGITYSYVNFKNIVKEQTQLLEQKEADSKHQFLMAYDSLRKVVSLLGESYVLHFDNKYNFIKKKKKNIEETNYFLFSKELFYLTYDKSYLEDLKYKSIAETYTYNAMKELDENVKTVKGHDIKIFNQIEKTSFFKEATNIPKANRRWPNLTGYHYDKSKLKEYSNLIREIKQKKKSIDRENNIKNVSYKNDTKDYNYNFNTVGKKLFKKLKNSKNIYGQKTNNLAQKMKS